MRISFTRGNVSHLLLSGFIYILAVFIVLILAVLIVLLLILAVQKYDPFAYFEILLSSDRRSV